MRNVNPSLAEAIGRITVDPAMLALFLHDSNRAIAELHLDLSLEDLHCLQRYVEALSAPGSQSRATLFSVLRPAFRTVQN
jgi:hypothetical protein